MKDTSHMALRIEKEAERFLHTYRDQIEMLESKSAISKVRTVTPYDIYSLGKQLESFDVYRSLCEEDGTLAQLGRIPDVAFDVLTVAYGASPISVIASVQPIDEEKGTVYYKNVVATSTRGNINAGDTLFAPIGGEVNTPIGYASDTSTIVVGKTAAGTKTYNFNLGNVPLRPYKQSISIGEVNGRDDGNGHIVGYGIQGLINYQTGAVSIQFFDEIPADLDIVFTACQDMEGAKELPSLILKLTTKSVDAQTFVLRDTIGLEQSYALRRRFGMVAEDEVASDLIAAINSEIVGTTVMKLRAGAQGNVNWSKRPPEGVSYVDHKMTIKDSLSSAEANILANSGRGTVSVLVAGREAASILATLPGFTKIADGTQIGPHIFGTLDGTTVVRIPNSQILPANEILAIYNSGSPFESAAVYAPYMPLVVTTALPTGQNPLMNQKAAAVWAAVDLLVPQFITKITMTD